jgi:hypothetical protein
VLEGLQAAQFLKLVRGLSQKLKTGMDITDGVGLIDLAGKPPRTMPEKKKSGAARGGTVVVTPKPPSVPALKTGNK